MMFLAILMLINACLVTSVDVKVKVDENGEKVVMVPEVGVEVKLPKGLQDLDLDKLDSMDQIDPGILDLIKNATDAYNIPEYTEDGELGCIHVMQRLALKGLPAVNTCLKEMQLTVGKLRKRMRELLPCMVRCVGTQMNVFKPDGTFNFAYMPDLLEETIPPRMHSLVGRVMKKCLPHVKGINPNDPTCDSYRPVMKCFVEGAFEIADEALDLCSDIPDVFKRAAKRVVKSKKTQRRIAKFIDPQSED